MRSTHTYAILEVSQQCYDEIAAKLRAAGYDHAFGTDGTIDMQGIGLSPEEEPEPECCCRRVDVDREDASDCPAHGPGSPYEKAAKALEAEDEARAAARIPHLLGIDPKTWGDDTPF